MDRDRRISRVWEYFTKKGNFTATCNACNNDYSYKSSVSNLRKHYYKQHTQGTPSDATIDNSETSDEEHEDRTINGTGKPTWKYFDVLDSDKFEANCKICGNTIPYKTMSDLTTHVTEHGEKPKDSDDDEEPQVSRSPLRKTHKNVSQVWQYYKKIDSVNKSALCLLCQKVFSYATSVSNLKKHLIRTHHLVKFPNNDDDIKKVIISANGQLYEVESSSHKVEVDDEQNPIDMDTVYLEEFDDTLDQLEKEDTHSSSNTPKKKETYSIKRKYSSKIPKEQFLSERRNSNVRNGNRDTSSEDEVRKKKHFTKIKTKMDSLDYFGQYMISLMKELPKSVSDQLQGEIIKQIISTKVALESQTGTNYAITVNENNLNQSSQVNTEPVTVTIRESKEVTENTNNVMVPESTKDN